MYFGLREKLIGEKTLDKGILLDIVGEKELSRRIKKLNSHENYVFVYKDSSRDSKIDCNNFENCFFDTGGVYLNEGIIYFRKERFLWEGSPINGLFDIIPVKSIIEENKPKKDIKVYTFYDGASNISVIHYNPIEAWASVPDTEKNRGLWKNRLGEIKDFSLGMFSSYSYPSD